MWSNHQSPITSPITNHPITNHRSPFIRYFDEWARRERLEESAGRYCRPRTAPRLGEPGWTWAGHSERLEREKEEGARQAQQAQEARKSGVSNVREGRGSGGGRDGDRRVFPREREVRSKNLVGAVVCHCSASPSPWAPPRCFVLHGGSSSRHFFLSLSCCLGCRKLVHEPAVVWVARFPWVCLYLVSVVVWNACFFSGEKVLT